MLNKIYTYKKVEILNNWRKYGDDWQIDIYKWSKMRIPLMYVAIILILSLSVASSLIVNSYEININEVLSLFNLFFIFSIILSSIGHFSNNQTVFLEDDKKLINKNSQFRFIRVISSFLYSTAKKFIIYWILVYAPFYFLANSLSKSSIVEYLKLISIFGLSLFFGLSFISLLFFLAHKYVLKNRSWNLFKFFKHIVTIVFLFITIFTAISILIDGRNIENFLSILSTYNVYEIQIQIQDIFNNDLYYTVLFSLFILLNVISVFLWYMILKKEALILYTQFNYVEKDYTHLFMKYSKLFFLKDLIHLNRLGGWLLSYLLKTLYVTVIIAAISVPIILKIWGESYLSYISISIALSVIMYQLLGDSLKIILSVDSEKDHIYLLLNKNKDLWFIVKEKWFIYCLFSLGISILLSFISLVFSSNIFVSLITAIISFTFGNITGLFQISTTAVYPKLNWEHYHEIGQSKKGKMYDEFLSYILTVIYTTSLLLIFIPNIISLGINIEILVFILLLFYIVINILSILMAKLFLSKKTIEESFIK